MAPTYRWSIAQCEHDVASGDIIVAHWRCTADEGRHAAQSYGTVAFEAADPTAPTYKPYATVTEADVLAWVWEAVDKAKTEGALAEQLASKIAPRVSAGLPWAVAQNPAMQRRGM